MQNVDHEPDFNWWEKQVLRRQDKIISKVNHRGAKKYVRKTMNFGIECPTTLQEAMSLDNKNGNNLWSDVISKEIHYVRVAFDIRGKEDTTPPGHKLIYCHMILYVKMEDLQRKARVVAGGHMTDVQPFITYASVVYSETLRIDLTMAPLNDMSVKTAYIIKNYIKAPCGEKLYNILGPEFRTDEGKMLIIVKSLYGLKSSGASFQNHFSGCIQFMIYMPCLADPYIWMRPMKISINDFKIYE